MSYAAIVSKLENVREHPNADRLKLADVRGVQVVVGLDAVDGQLGIFFPEDGQLDVEYATQNDLYPRYENGERYGGFFDPKNSRVRAQKFRKERSTGYFASIESVKYTGIDLSTLVDGVMFTELNGHEICRKYYSPKTLEAMAGQQQAQKKNIMFPEHVDTLRYQYSQDDVLKPGNLVYVTEKIHGTSGRYGYVLSDIEYDLPRSFWQWLTRKPATKAVKQVWEDVVGTRRVVLKSDSNGGFHGSNDFRYKIAENWQEFLNPGEVIYGEIVGWVDQYTTIMSTQDTRKLEEIAQRYGPNITYSYGTLQGKCEFYAYRIAQMDLDGNTVELPWSQVKRRCAQLGIRTVPELVEPVYITSEEQIAELKETYEGLLENCSVLDPSHPREGIVLRVEAADGTTSFVKSKSFTFGVLEGYIKDNEDHVDLEEIS